MNGIAFGENSTIYLNEECQSNVIVCMTPRRENVLDFGLGDTQPLTTWATFEDNSTHHVVILRMEDIPSNSTTTVSMNVLIEQSGTANTLPSPFTFKIVDQSAGTCVQMVCGLCCPQNYVLSLLTFNLHI